MFTTQYTSAFAARPLESVCRGQAVRGPCGVEKPASRLSRDVVGHAADRVAPLRRRRSDLY